jgi:hypothetical protein
MSKVPTLWDQLPKAEQEKVKKHLASLPDPQGAKNGKNGRGGFQLKGYVRCELSASDKEAYREWESQHTNVECYEQLIKAADSGYLVKVGEAGQGYMASLCASSTGKGWDGYVLTAHAGHSARASMLLVYKHEILLRGDWSDCLEEGGEDFMR